MSFPWAALIISALLLLLPSVLAAPSDFHRHLSPLQLFNIFQVHTQNDVPEYEVTRVHAVRSKRAAQDEPKHVHLQAFGRRLHLRLTRNAEFEGRLRKLKVLAAESVPGGNLSFSPLSGASPENHEEEVGGSYHDLQEMAALLVRRGDNGRLELEGTIGNELVIRPLPQSILATQNDDEDHVVFKRKIGLLDEQSDFANMEIGDKANISLPHSRRKREAPDTVWPEVLLVVDFDTYLLHGASSRDVKRYFVSFFNGVDLRYKLLTYPRVRVSLAGMIVAKDRDATPYLERNRLRPPNGDAVDAAGALTDLGKYLYREDRLPTYDLAVVITKLDMCRRRFEGGRCNRGTAGFAYVGGACVVNKRLEKVNSVAIIEDSGGFSGIIVAAHEIGHLLGCVHDGSPPPSYLGGPGATHCPWEDGFIMSDLRHTERGFRWSSCSVEQFKHFLNGETASCLYNYPHENELLTRVLPGNVLSLDDQCQRDRGTNACFKDARVCAQLFCFDSASGYCVSYRPAAEGSTCGDGQSCSSGKCQAELENIIPDYTHVSQTYVRSPSRRQRRQVNQTCRDKGGCEDLSSHSLCSSKIYKSQCCRRYKLLCPQQIASHVDV